MYVYKVVVGVNLINEFLRKSERSQAKPKQAKPTQTNPTKPNPTQPNITCLISEEVWLSQHSCIYPGQAWTVR